jgi:hypothetical protein
MQMQVASQGMRAGQAEAAMREKAREFDANMELRKAELAQKDKEYAQRIASEQRKAIEEKNARLDAEANARAEATQKLRIANRAAKAAQQKRIFDFAWSNILQPWLNPKAKDQTRNVYSQVGQGAVGSVARVLTVRAPRRKKRKRKKRRLTGLRKRRVG